MKKQLLTECFWKLTEAAIKVHQRRRVEEFRPDKELPVRPKFFPADNRAMRSERKSGVLS